MSWRTWISVVEAALDADCLDLSAADLAGVPLVDLYVDGTWPRTAALMVAEAWSYWQGKPLVACLPV